MILSKKDGFQNIKIKLNSRTWMTLESSVVIFQALESLYPQGPRQPHFTKKNTEFGLSFHQLLHQNDLSWSFFTLKSKQIAKLCSLPDTAHCEALQQAEGTKKMKSTSFHQYS
jgi:hypothetical protein